MEQLYPIKTDCCLGGEFNLKKVLRKIAGQGLTNRPDFTQEEIDRVHKRGDPSTGVREPQRRRPIKLKTTKSK